MLGFNFFGTRRLREESDFGTKREGMVGIGDHEALTESWCAPDVDKFPLVEGVTEMRQMVGVFWFGVMRRGDGHSRRV